MNESIDESSCVVERPLVPVLTVSLPVLGSGRAGPVRKSLNSRWRALSLVAIHLAIIGHIAHWLITGRTLSPVEPSEAMFTINDGQINAGAIFFALAIVATLIFGRFLCGWGCHLVAYQDFCAWLLKKVGIKPKPFRSRLLVFAPLLLALYMFVWPSVYRWWFGVAGPKLSNHVMTSEFWATFPGLTIAVLTLFLCGFVIVYFLGSKGFCTYACPYGGIFGLAGQMAPGRILVTDACRHCGHCTATCTSNVRVHEEVALYGMVVDPGCMKCMDCVSVCPNNALHFGFAIPPIGARPKARRRPKPYDFVLWEEVLAVAVGLAALLTFRGLYGRIPLLLAMGLAAMTAYLSIVLIRLILRPNVRLQNLVLKRGGRVMRAGRAFAVCMTAWLLIAFHSGVVQGQSWTGRRLVGSLYLGDEPWLKGRDWWLDASAEHRERLASAIGRLERADRWGLLWTPAVLHDMTWAYLARGETEKAEQVVRRMIELMPGQAEPHRGLAGVLRKAGRREEATRQYREAIRLKPGYPRVRKEFCGLLVEMGRFEEAVTQYRSGMDVSPDDNYFPLGLSRLLINLKRFTEAKELLTGEPAARLFRSGGSASVQAFTARGIALLRSGEVQDGINDLVKAIELDPNSADAHYNLGYGLLGQERIEEAIEHLARAVEVRRDFAVAHYNLGVATFMTGRPTEALPHLRAAIHFAPGDPDAHGFIAVVLEHLGDSDGAREAAANARRLAGEGSPR